MGLGKTISTISLLICQAREKMNGPTLIVCPATVLTHWRNEIGDMNAMVNHCLSEVLVYDQKTKATNGVRSPWKHRKNLLEKAAISANGIIITSYD